MRNAKVLLRAHGEPPETYMIARENNIEIIDATCPVVLRLQKRIKQEFLQDGNKEKQIIIYGKIGVDIIDEVRQRIVGVKYLRGSQIVVRSICK